MFEAPIFTDAGRVLLNRAIAGENLIFSSIKMGKGDIGSVEIASMTDLIDPVAVLDIYKIKAEKETATITASFSNKDLEQGFSLKNWDSLRRIRTGVRIFFIVIKMHLIQRNISQHPAVKS